MSSMAESTKALEKDGKIKIVMTNKKDIHDRPQGNPLDFDLLSTDYRLFSKYCSSGFMVWFA